MTLPPIGARVRIVRHRPVNNSPHMRDLRGCEGTVEHVHGTGALQLSVRLDAQPKRAVAVFAGEWEVCA